MAERKVVDRRWKPAETETGNSSFNKQVKQLIKSYLRWKSAETESGNTSSLPSCKSANRYE